MFSAAMSEVDMFEKLQVEAVMVEKLPVLVLVNKNNASESEATLFRINLPAIKLLFTSRFLVVIFWSTSTFLDTFKSVKILKLLHSINSLTDILEAFKIGVLNRNVAFPSIHVNTFAVSSFVVMVFASIAFTSKALGLILNTLLPPTK